MKTLSLSPSFSLFLVTVKVDSKDTWPSRWTQELKKSFHCDVSLLSRQRVSFLSFSLSMWPATNHMIRSFILSFFLSHFTFFFFKDYNKKRKGSHLYFFFSFFLCCFTFFSLKITIKNARDLIFLSFFFLSFFHSTFFL